MARLEKSKAHIFDNVQIDHESEPLRIFNDSTTRVQLGLTCAFRKHLLDFNVSHNDVIHSHAFSRETEYWGVLFVKQSWWHRRDDRCRG